MHSECTIVITTAIASPVANENVASSYGRIHAEEMRSERGLNAKVMLVLIPATISRDHL